MKRSVIALAVGLMFGGMAQPAGAQMYVFENPLVKEEAPDFTLKNLSGKSVNYKKLVKGKNSILFFWATWCPHCRQEIKDFPKKMQGFKDNNVELILIDVGEDLKKVENHLKRNKIQLDVLLDKDGAVSEQYAVIGYPTYVFVDKDGVVQDVQHGLPEDYNELFK